MVREQGPYDISPLRCVKTCFMAYYVVNFFFLNVLWVWAERMFSNHWVHCSMCRSVGQPCSRSHETKRMPPAPSAPPWWWHLQCLLRACRFSALSIWGSVISCVRVSTCISPESETLHCSKGLEIYFASCSQTSFGCCLPGKSFSILSFTLIFSGSVGVSFLSMQLKPVFILSSLTAFIF